MSIVRFVGQPTGPEIYVAEYGCSVKTFTQQEDRCLMHHVPMHMRGDFRPNELANYDPTKEYRTDSTGRMLCYAPIKAGTICNKRAINRAPYCQFHGGSLHPLDKVVKDEKPTETTRYRLFCAGKLDVDDLDDEELASCGFRAKDGRIYKPKNVPREMAQAFTRTLFERAQQELRSNTVKAAETLAGIMLNEKNDASIRLKAADLILERSLGKAPQVVSITTQSAYEVIFSDLVGGSRDESRQRRAIEQSNIIDADEVYDATDVSVDSTTEESPNGESIQFSTEPKHENQRDARLFKRDSAIMAQTVEIKPYEFEFDIPLIRKKIKTKNGKIRIRHVAPEQP